MQPPGLELLISLYIGNLALAECEKALGAMKALADKSSNKYLMSFHIGNKALAPSEKASKATTVIADTLLTSLPSLFTVRT